MARPHLWNPDKERFWRKQVEAWQRSGLSVREFCRRRGLSEASFYAWRRELPLRDRERLQLSEEVDTTSTGPGKSKPTAHKGRRLSGSAADGYRKSGKPAATPSAASATPLFVPLSVRAQAAANDALEVQLCCGTVVRLRPGFCRDDLLRVLRALEGE
jgi:hypothetical protein